MSLDRRTRILIIDDSALMRTMLRTVLSTDPAMEVAGTASDGESGLLAVQKLRPDLVLLDVEMPVMDGLVTLRKLRASGERLPVIMCSSATQRGARVTIEALSSGASDYVAKPAGQADRETALRTLAHDLFPKIKALTRGSSAALVALPPMLPVALPRTPASPAAPALVAIGVSTGGPAALDVVLPALGSRFPLPVLVVQHMPEVFTGTLAERLGNRCSMPVREAVEGAVAQAGTIYIARGNWHLAVHRAHAGAAPTLHLSQSSPQNHCRPSVDVLLETATQVYGGGVLAVILTGMGSDGLGGCRKVRAAGGSVIAQDEATSAVWGMPGAVCRAGLADRTLPLDLVAAEIFRFVHPAREARETVA